MMRRFTAAIMLATVLSTGTAFARPGGGGGPLGGGIGPDAGMMLPLLLRKLDLTDAQHQQVHTILNTHRAALQTLFPRLRDAQQALEAKLLSADPVQVADLAPQIQQVADLRKQIMEQGVAIALEVRSVLTPQQLARAAELHTQIAALRSQMRALVGEPPMDPPE
jgi:Spy/CpxP family protein refolding chaperone